MAAGNPEVQRKLEFTDIVGKFGKWQFIICFNVWMGVIVNSMNNFAVIFQAADLQYWCTENYKGKDNLSVAEWIGIKHDKYERSQECTYKSWDHEQMNKTLINCNHWTYDTSVYPNSLVSQFNLVCDRKWMISLLKSAYMFGYMAAGVFTGLSDRFGRRPLLLVPLALFVVCSFASAFSVSFTMMLILRFLLSLGISTCTNTSFVLQTEVVGPKQRVLLSYLRSGIWTVGMLILVALAYFIRDWFWLQMAISIPGLFLLFSIYWFVPESPRFLLTQGDAEQSAKILENAASLNGRKIPDTESVLKDLLSGIQKGEMEKKSSHASWIDLFRTPEIRKRTLLLYFVWFSTIFVYYGLLYNVNRLYGDVYLNFTISTALEVPFLVVFLFISYNFGRRKSLAAAAGLCGCTLLISLFVPKENPFVVTGLLIAGKVFLRSTIGDIYIYTAEVFPTVLRSIALGSCSTFSRLGGMASPFAWEGLGGGDVPCVLFGVLATVAGFTVFILPETKNRNVSDTIQEARNFGRQQEVIYYPQEKDPENAKPLIV